MHSVRATEISACSYSHPAKRGHHYRPEDVFRHADALVCLPHRDTLPRPAARSPRLAPAIPSTITRPPFQFASSLPVFDSATNCRSNPIAHRVRRKRQRLPPSLLIENASDRDSARPQSLPEAFPIKASDNPEVGKLRRAILLEQLGNRRPPPGWSNSNCYQ